MKKTITTILISIMSLITFAQEGSVSAGNLNYKKDSNGLVITFRNMEYHQIIDMGGFSLSDTGSINSFEANLLTAVNSNDEKFYYSGSFYKLSGMKQLGFFCVMIMDLDGKYVIINKKQAIQLVNKLKGN